MEFPENNEVNALVATITVGPGVILEFKPPPANPNNPFILNGNQLLAARVFDYEVVSYVQQNMYTALRQNLTVEYDICSVFADQ